METEHYDIHICREDEYDKLVDFLDKHWIHNHVFVQSKELLDFQHFDKDRHLYNFVIAVNKETKEVDAIQGFIPTYLYDANLYDNGDFWCSFWKRRDDVDNGESGILGILVLSYVWELENFKTYGSIGLSVFAQNMYNALGLDCGVMDQYYIANPYFEQYQLIRKPAINPLTCSDASVIRKITIDEVTVKGCYRPIKTKTFFLNRYANHPFWHYDFYSVENEGEQVAVFVTRIVNSNGSSCLRIVDVLGDLSKVGYIANGIVRILQEDNAEYVDFMNHGIAESVFYKMGFLKVDLDSDEVIVPNYFEPYVEKNIKLHFGIKADNTSDYVIFKADGDQDRPSRV